MYTCILVYALTCYTVHTLSLTNCTELAYIENLSLNDNIVSKANVAMLGNITNPCPQQVWTDAIEYACHSDDFGLKNKIGTSPYLYINQRHVHLKYLHPFWTPIYFTIPPNERIGSKLGVARALKGYFVGYSYSKFLQPCYKVVARYANGTFGRVRHTKDVIFDMNVNFHSVDDNDLPSAQEFSKIPVLELVADADNADALRRQLILPPALPVSLPHDVPDPLSHLTCSSLKLPILIMKSAAPTTR